MRKLFPLASPKHKPPQALAAIKNEVRKYLKRERRKALPEGADTWEFDCKVGPARDQPEVAQVTELIAAIDRASLEGWETIYIEILARPAKRPPRGARNPKPPKPTKPAASRDESDGQH